jgi:hypothetical protein
MRRGTGRWLGVLLAAALLAAPAAAQAPRSVTFSGQIFEAANTPPTQPSDPAVLASLPSQWQKTFQEYKQYRSLGTFSGSTVVGKPYAVTRGSVTLEATPKSADAGTITVDVRVLRGSAPVVGSTVRLAPGGQVGVGGQQGVSGSPDGAAVLVLLTGR